MPPVLEVFLRFLRLGFTAFGGPIAHLGYFRREFVDRARWLDDATYAEIVALCTVLPGPTSSQVGMLLGAQRAGRFGALAAWLGFTLPSAAFLAVVGRYARAVPFGMNVPSYSVASAAFSGALAALQPLAFAVVLLAVVHLWRTIVVTSFARAVVPVAFGLALAALVYAPAWTWVVLVVGGLLGARYAPSKPQTATHLRIVVSPRVGLWSLGALFALLALSTIAARPGYGELFATTLRAGSLVFGGGHVVLAFLTPLVSARGIDASEFASGYGIVQAVPGPLFTFASFLGAADDGAANPWLAATIATIGIFLPSFLLLPAALALWSRIRSAPRAGAILAGLSVAVVGLLAATFVVVFVPTVLSGAGPIAYGLIALIAYLTLARARLPAWAVVVGVAATAAAYSALAFALRFPAHLRLV